VAATVVAGAVTALVVAPAAGAPVAAAAALALGLAYGRGVLAAGTVGLVVAVDVVVTRGQALFGYPAEFGWPTHFERAGTLAWMAVAGLAADALVQEVRVRRVRRVAPSGPPAGSPSGPGPRPGARPGPGSPPGPAPASGHAAGAGPRSGAPVQAGTPTRRSRRRGLHVRRTGRT